MKNIALTLITVGFLFACNSAQTADDAALSTTSIEHGENSTAEPKIEFKESSWDFGTVAEGEQVEHTFKFTNTGDDDLVIGNVKSTCGCTVPSWPKTPIKPGEDSKITVEFNSAGKSGIVTKDITIYANTVPVTTKLRIKVFVDKK